MKDSILPSAYNLARYKNWTGLTVIQLVEAGRLSPKDGAKQAIERMCDEMSDAGKFPSVEDIPRLIDALDILEDEVFTILSNHCQR